MLKAKNRSPVKPKQILKQYEIAAAELEKTGVVFFVPGDNLSIDADYLSIPDSITEISPSSLGEMLSAFTQQKMYIRTVLSWQATTTEEARLEYGRRSFGIYTSLEVKMSETAKERHIMNDPDASEYYTAWQHEAQKQYMLEQNLKSLEDAIFLISREISRREFDWTAQTREHNI